MLAESPRDESGVVHMHAHPPKASEISPIPIRDNVSMALFWPYPRHLRNLLGTTIRALALRQHAISPSHQEIRRTRICSRAWSTHLASCIMFALLRVVRFLCKRRAFSGRPPCGVAFGSHFYFPASVISPCRPTFTLMPPMLRHGFYSGFCCWN